MIFYQKDNQQLLGKNRQTFRTNFFLLYKFLIVNQKIMFPFQKIFTLLIRTFSRPMLGYVKRKQIEKPGSRFAGFFIGLGRQSLRFEYWVNHRILKTVRVRHPPELKEEVLLQKGIESFYEILFYLIVLGLPFWELYKSSIAAQKKEEALQKRISNLEKKMGHINERIGKIVDYAKEKSKEDRQKSRKQVSQSEKLKENKQKQQLNNRLNAMGETTSSGETESVSEKIEELFQNAIEVMADEFEDSLDELDFSSEDIAESSLDGVQAEGEAPDVQETAELDLGGGDSSPQVAAEDISVQTDEVLPSE